MRNSIAALLVLLAGLLPAIPVFGQEAIEVLAPAGAAEFSYQRLDDDKLLISVADSQGRPLRNLTIDDFAVMRDDRRAQIMSAEPLETSTDVSLNIVIDDFC